MKNPRQRDEEERKRESGLPGGGKGRIDEVGRSGVYPMSGPHPAGEAELKEQASWGQGERGAAGYEDHGGSELTFEGGQLLGGLNVGAGGEPRAPTMETTRDIDVARDQWISFLDNFSRQHLDWLVTIEVIGAEGKLLAVEERPLKGVSVDHAGGHERAYVQVGDTPKDHVTHTIDSPTQVRFKQSPIGEHQGLEIMSADGTTTLIRFRSAMRPEMLDGIAA